MRGVLVACAAVVEDGTRPDMGREGAAERAWCGLRGSACVCTRVHGCAAIHVYVHPCMDVYIHPCVCTNNVSMGVCTQLHTCVCMCMCTHVHARVCWCSQQVWVCRVPRTPRLPPPPAAESSPGWHVCVCVTSAPPGPAHGRTDGQKELAGLARRATGATGSSEYCRLPACPAASCLRMLLLLGWEDARQQPGFPVLPGRRVGQDVRPRARTPPAPLTLSALGLSQPGSTTRSQGPRRCKPPAGPCAARPA